MAKGNMFLSQARGKVGSVVFSVIRGQQVERVHNPSPANPRTLSQQAQRSLLANMTKFYKRGTQNFYKFAFEDRSIRESDFNAFARHNMQQGVYMPKNLYDDPATPALGEYIIADGSLSTNIKDYFSGENYGILVDTANVVATVGALSALLIAENPQIVEGDIFTMVLADSDLNAALQPASTAPTWQIMQFYLDPSDLRPLSAVGLADLGLVGVETGRLIGVDIIGVDRASFGAVVISRNTPSGLKVSTSQLRGSAVANVLFDWLTGSYMKRVAAVSWGGNPEAVLQGGLLETLPEIDTLQFGSETPQLAAYTYGVTTYNIQGASSSEIVLTGSNLRTTAQGAKYVVKFYSARILADGLVTNPVDAYEFTAAGSSSTLTLSRPSRVENPGNQFYMLVECDGVPVWYGLGINNV